MTTGDKIGLYGKGTADASKARASAKKAAEHAAKNFSKTKAYNCTVQPQPANDMTQS
ncbi:MAG: hypothetical protein ABI651_14235 [Verrucomicrobiota bacterium]